MQHRTLTLYQRFWNHVPSFAAAVRQQRCCSKTTLLLCIIDHNIQHEARRPTSWNMKKCSDGCSVQMQSIEPKLTWPRWTVSAFRYSTLRQQTCTIVKTCPRSFTAYMHWGKCLLKKNEWKHCRDPQPTHLPTKTSVNYSHTPHTVGAASGFRSHLNMQYTADHKSATDVLWFRLKWQLASKQCCKYLISLMHTL